MMIEPQSKKYGIMVYLSNIVGFLIKKDRTKIPSNGIRIVHLRKALK